MFGFAWSELILIGAVALVVIGPKDLPKVMRTAGQWSRKLRFLASDFQRHLDDMIRQSELDEVKREAEKAMDVGSIAGDMEKAVGVAEFEKSMSFDEASAAASVPSVSAPAASVRSGVELPELPVESVASVQAPVAAPHMAPVNTEPVATNQAAAGLSELPSESVAPMLPPDAAPRAEPVNLEPDGGAAPVPTRESSP
jgi:sec-independent protein translocase protein TatB